MAAQQLAQNRPGARGAVLLESCVPPSEFGSGWPAEVPVQVHGGEQDPVFAGEGDLDAARELVEEAEDGQLYLYPVDRHLFVDSSLSTYDAEATRVLLERVTGFLARL
jgi:dienelactone hydrolase